MSGWSRALQALVVVALLVPALGVRESAAEASTDSPIDLGISGHAAGINSLTHVVGVDDETGQGFLWVDGAVTALDPAEGGSAPADINDSGLIVGRAGADTWPRSHRAVAWKDGRISDLDTLGGTWSEANALNDRGQIVGTSETEDGHRRAVVWTQGRLRALEVPGALHTEAADINNKGEIVGTAWFDEYPHSRAVVWSGKSVRVLSYQTEFDHWETLGQAINERGDAVAHARADAAFPHGVVWHRRGATTALPFRGYWTVPVDVNAAGLVVANQLDESAESLGFVWDPRSPGEGTTLPGHADAPFYPTTWAGAISGDGVVAGSALAGPDFDDAERRAVIWRR